MVSGRRLAGFAVSMLVLTVGWSGCASSHGPVSPDPVPTPKTSSGTLLTPAEGRYQLVVVPGNPPNPFLVDTTNGCVWHLVQNEKTKRATFIETDVENLHWGWGSGAQQILAGQIDALNSPEADKKVLKQNLQKTECGQFNVTLSSEQARKAEQHPDSKPEK
jgi:hypothetical protein